VPGAESEERAGLWLSVGGFGLEGSSVPVGEVELTSDASKDVLGGLPEQSIAEHDRVLTRDGRVDHLRGFGGRHAAGWSAMLWADGE